MKISSTDVLIKSYLDVRLQSLKVTGWSWLSWLAMTVDLSIILTYISPPKAARGVWIPFTMVKLYCWSISDGGMSHCCMSADSETARKVTVVCSRLQKLRAYSTDRRRVTVWRHSVNVIYFAKLGYSVSMLSYQLCYNNFLLLFSFRTGQNIQKHYIK